MGGTDRSCCVPGCGKTRKDDVVLHSFPNPEKEMDRYIAWTQTVGMDSSREDPEFVLKNRKICHVHFEEKFLTWSRRLSPGAIPTLFLGPVKTEGSLNEVTNTLENVSMQPAMPSALRGSTTHHVEEIKIPVPWGEVAGRWWGPRDRQPILATHGWQDNAGTWNRLIPLLPPSLSVLCIDLPGMGLSSHYPKGMVYYKYWDGLVLIRRIVKHFNWEKVVLMGHSLGGSISFMYAAMYPDDIDRLICVDIASPAMETTQDIVKIASRSIDQLLRYENFKNDALSESYEEMIDMVVEAYGGSVSRPNCKIMMERGMTRNVVRGKVGYYFNRDPKLKFSSLGMISLDEALEMATKIKCRILNIKANPAPNISHTFYDYYERVVVALQESTDVTFVEVDGTHHVHLETPENIVAHVHDFIEDLC